jgi:hypothetical protein
MNTGRQPASSVRAEFVRSYDMDRKRPDGGWRASALAAALFAITLNFLQPLVHAALMRDGGPTALSLWTSMCLPSDGHAEQQDSMPVGKQHECCLGLAHAPVLAAPSSAFVAIDLPATIVRPLEAVQSLAPVGIRDGPNQPRGPPSFA